MVIPLCRVNVHAELAVPVQHWQAVHNAMTSLSLNFH
jgi:hypothetical protein